MSAHTGHRPFLGILVLMAVACKNEPGENCADGAETWEGDLGEADVADLCAEGCDVRVTGSVVLKGTSLVDLDGLSCVSGVDGDVILENNDALTSISGLAGLREVGGSLAVGSFIPYYDEAYDKGNPVLTSLDGLQNVERVGVNLLIAGNGALVDPGQGFAALESIGHDQEPGASALLGVAANAALTSLPAFPKLAELSDIIITANPSLGSLAGLEALRGDEPGAGGEHWITITDNDALASLSGLDGLGALNGHLVVAYNDGLSSVAGLDNLSSVAGMVDFQHNPSLASLQGLGALTSVGGWVTIGDSDALTTLEGLGALTSVDEDFNVLDNDGLVSLNGVEAMRTIGGTLQIGSLDEPVGNDALADLDGLHGLTSVGGDVLVTCGPALTASEVDDLVAAIDQIGGVVTATCD